MSPGRRRGFIAASFAVSAVALWVALRGLDWDQVRDALSRARPMSIALAVVFLALGIATRTERWHALAGVDGGRLRFFRAEAFGYLANFLYPARAGDALRIGMVTAQGACPLWRAVLAAVGDRALDVAVLLGTACALIVWMPEVPLRGEIVGLGGLVVIAGLVLFLWPPARRMVVLRAADVGERVVARILGPAAPSEGVRDAARLFGGNLRSGRTHARVGAALVATACMDYAAVASMLDAFGWFDRWHAPVVLWLFVSAGGMIPAAPGALGVYQVACVLALGLQGVPAAAAIAYSFVAQLTTLAGIGVASLLAMMLVAAEGRGRLPASGFPGSSRR